MDIAFVGKPVPVAIKIQRSALVLYEDRANRLGSIRVLIGMQAPSPKQESDHQQQTNDYAALACHRVSKRFFR